MSYSININELVKESWEVVKGKIGTFAGILAIMWLVNVAPSSINKVLAGNSIAILIVSLAFMIPQIVLSMGVLKYTLAVISSDDAPEFSLIFTQYSYFWKFLLASIVYNVIVGLGMLLLVIPGVYLGLRLQFFSYLIVDQDMGPIDAIKESFAMTSGRTLDLFLLALVALAINLIGALALIIGLVVTIPITMVIYAKVYKGLLEVAEA